MTLDVFVKLRYSARYYFIDFREREVTRHDILSGITIEFDRLQTADQKHHRPQREKTAHSDL